MTDKAPEVSWWLNCTRAEFTAEIAKRFAVNRAERKTGASLTLTSEQAARAASRRKGAANRKRTLASQGKGSTLLPKAETLRSEFGW